MRRVVIVVHAVYPGDPRVHRQADALLDAGYEVDIVCLRQPGEPGEEIDGRLRLVRLPVNRRFVGFAGHLLEYAAFTAMAAWRVAAEHRRRRYDLVQVATVPDFLSFAAVPEKLAGVPLLLDLHEDMPEFFRDRFAARPLRPLLPVVDLASRASAALADELITVHEPLRRLSIARGVDPERISVVMNGADRSIFDLDLHGRRPFMADGILRLIHHSNLQRLYGIDRAIEQLASIDDLPWRLDLFGDGPWRGHIEAAIDRAGVADRVTLHGRVPITQLPAQLANADIGLVPSLPEPYLEYSLSTKLLEYAAMAVPVIATDLATFRAHFTDAAVRFVDGDDPTALPAAVRALAADPDRAAALGREACRQAAPYAWEVQAPRYLEIVDRLIGRAGRA